MNIKRNFFDFSLFFLIIYSPLFFGSVLPLPFAIIQFSCLGILFLLIAKIVLFSSRQFIYPVSLKYIIIFALICFLQLILFPASLIKLLSPNTYSLVQNFSTSKANLNFLPLSIYSYSSRIQLISYSLFFLVFLFVINIIKRKKQVERIIVLITLLAVILSFYAIIWHYFILEKTMTGSFGTFGNRNHFAAYIGMIAPLVIGYSLSCRNRFKRFFFGFLGAFLSASVFLSLSRAGSISLGVALLLMIFFLKKDWFKEGKIWLIGSVILIAVILVILAGTDLIFERFSYFWENLDKRLSLFRDSLGIVKDFPLFGVGLGNFQYIFTAYRTAPAYNYYYYLHNDYMQLIVEAGLLGAFFYFLFLFQTFKKIITKLRKRHDLFVKNIVIGGGCGLIGTLIHSFFDFNFHIPAVFIMFYIILGIIYKIVNIHFYSKPMAKNNDNQKN